MNSNANKVILYDDKTFPSYLTPTVPFYQGNSFNLSFADEDQILQNIGEEVYVPRPEETTIPPFDDDINFTTPLLPQPPSLQEFKPQPSTFEDQILPPYQEFKLQPSTSQDYKPPEQTHDYEDSLMKIANQFCTIPPPKAPVLVPPPTSIIRGLPNFNTFKVNDKKSSKSKISNSHIKQVIQELRGITPNVDIRTLCFLNVLDHKYYGSNLKDNGVLIKVVFNEAVDYAFRRKFVALTKEGKDLFFIKFCKCRSSGEYFHLLQLDSHQRGKMTWLSFCILFFIAFVHFFLFYLIYHKVCIICLIVLFFYFFQLDLYVITFNVQSTALI